MSTYSSLTSNTEKSGSFTFLSRMISMIARQSPVDFWMNIPVALLHSVSIVLITFANMKLFDQAIRFGQGGSTISAVITGIVWLGLANIINQVFNGLHNYMTGARSMKLVGIFRDILHQKASRLPPVLYEEPRFLDDLEKAKRGVSVGVYASDLVVTILTFYLPYFLFMAFFLGSLSPILVLTLVLIFLPVVAGQGLRMKLFSSLEDKAAPLRRDMEYREKTICDRQYFKETRLLGSFGYMRKLYSDAIELLNLQRWTTEKKSMMQMLCLKGITVIGYTGILVLLVRMLYTGRISAGSFAAIFASLGTMFSIAEEIVNMHIGSVAQDASSIRNLMIFLDINENLGEAGDFDAGKGIVLENVSFAYPGAVGDTLQKVNLEIASGEHVAIVGENGAGKSTIVKIIAGIYKPLSGTVTIGGLDSAGIRPQDIYRGYSAVFQNYQRYKMTLKENIVISDTEKLERETDGSVDAVLESAQFQYSKERFSEGYDTMLSREFDGVELSGGQWQRVAIARGIYRTSSMILLDEPTAAIDPLEEVRLYRQFAEISRGKTTIIVTHRLASTQIANKIVVMKAGRIEDVGTHAELLARGGYYAHMYRSQAQWYAT